MKDNAISENILFTGLSGWLGRTAERVLTLNLGIKTSQIEYIPSIANGDIKFRSEEKSYDSFVPLAFPPRDYYWKVSDDEYKSIAKRIIDRDKLILQSNNFKSVILISSGEVSEKAIRRSPDYKSYRDLKKYQEETLYDICSHKEVNLSICRVYSVTSKEISNFTSFAFSNFVDLASKNLPIKINNPGLVYRKYLDFGQLFEVLYKNRKVSKFEMLESSGELIEIRDLAKIVIETLNSSSILEHKNSSLEVENYFSESSTDYDLYRKYGIQPFNLKQQIKNVEYALGNNSNTQLTRNKS